MTDADRAAALAQGIADAFKAGELNARMKLSIRLGKIDTTLDLLDYAIAFVTVVGLWMNER